MKLILALILTFITSFAYSETTGNLLPNVNDGVDWNSNSTDMINDGSSGYVTNGSVVNGFTITCPTSQANCGYKYDVGGDFEVTGTATVSVNDIGLTNNTITQPMLDNGITLNSYIDVANCESTEGNCESKGGANDSHTTIVVLKDSNGGVLSTSSQTRTNVTGFQGNCNGYPSSTSGTITNACGQYNDSITYLGVGSNIVDWSWSGTDSNYTNQSRQGPNLLGASLNMTYNPIVLSDDITEDLNDIVIDDSFIDEIILDEIIADFETIDFEEVFIELEELDFEEVFILDVLPELEEFGFEEIYLEEFEDISLEDLEEIDFEEFEEIDFEEFEEIIAEAEIEEFNDVEEIDDVEMAEEETIEEEIEVAEETTEEISNDTLEEETPKAEGVLEESIESEEFDEIEEIKEIENEEIKVVSKDLKIDINDKIDIKIEEITLFSNQNALEVYTKNDFYKPQQIYSDIDNALFIQTDLGFYYGNIYTGVTLDNYISTDPISQHNEKLYDLKVNKLKIMIELKKLKGLL
tara:strand:- start:3412 stop:4980 length:1569 start_codon:yes stop_codon:yes gene_type:complete